MLGGMEKDEKEVVVEEVVDTGDVEELRLVGSMKLDEEGSGVSSSSANPPNSLKPAFPEADRALAYNRCAAVRFPFP
jgi:hypothetical protein